METLHYHFESGQSAVPPATGALFSPAGAALVGVVGSGNLEVLIEKADLQGGCDIAITTAAVGFGATWQAVVDDFYRRWQLADVRIAINDMGATPAVVSLRLDQAVETLMEQAP